MDDKLRSLYKLGEAKTWLDLEAKSVLEKMMKEGQSNEFEETARSPEFQYEAKGDRKRNKTSLRYDLEVEVRDC